ncbi:MAG TPA: helix-turn-helix transcriptional regulator, partial [Gaiellaceae bacterium]|nr:helix-turn-helix transcriptional regulator [Gaiellaceae bacterium]
MIDVLRTATRSELAAAAADPRLPDLLDELSGDQQYEARQLIWPERTREHVLWRIELAHGTFDDDEDAVYSALLDLTPAERRALWDERAQELSFLGEDELSLVRRMCVGDDGGGATEAAALDARMQIATDGLGTDDEAVSLVVGRVASLAEQETRLRAALDAGVTPEGEALTAEQRVALEVRVAELGGVHENLLASPRDDSGALAQDSFLGRLHDDVGTDEYGAFSRVMDGDPYEHAKQQLLDAAGALNDDEQAIYGAFRDLHAPLSLPPDRTTADYSPDELRQMREQATNALRLRLRNDPDLSPVWSALDDDELAVLDVHVAGDGYRIAIHELEDAYHGVDTDEARVLRIVAGMPAADRARMMAEQPLIYTELMTGLDAASAALVDAVFRSGRVPTARALDVAMGDWGDGTDEQMLLDSLGSMSDEERRGYRLGYWLHRQGRSASEVAGETERAALQRFRDLHARLEAELDDEELDAAMERLVGLPAPEDFLSPEGRRMAAEIMAHRHRERLALSGGVTGPSTSTDETAAQSAMIYEAHLRALLARGGEISLEDFSVLVGLDAQFGGRLDQHRATVELVSNIAGTVAATVAAVVIVVLSEGTLAPAAAELISSSGGAALWAAVSGAGARVGASEAFGGDFHQTMSTEGARNAMVGAIEGAVAVASAALAARAVELVGLSQRALAAAAGTSQSAVAAIEAGRKQPTVATLERLLRAADTELVPADAEQAALLRRGRRLEDVLHLAEAL